jgi:NTE family protein
MAGTALFLGGGAPNLTLMSGALLALHEQWFTQGHDFEYASMGGAGTVVGLLYMAPKNMSPADALKNTVNLGVSDLIYSMLPVNYKVFTKSGPSADLFYDWWLSLPAVQAASHQYGMNPQEKLYSDWLLLQGAMMCPTDVNYFSQGLCAHARFLDELIDFDKLSAPNSKKILISAYKLGDQPGPHIFSNNDRITADHVRAALSFPFLYPPCKVGETYYYEGAAYQSLQSGNIPLDSATGISSCIVLDVMQRELIRAPRDLWDAYGLSIIMPVAGNAEYGRIILYNRLMGTKLKEVAERYIRKLDPSTRPREVLEESERSDLFRRLNELRGLAELAEKEPYEEEAIKKDRWSRAKFKIPQQYRPDVLDWSRSNMERLFEIGYQAGIELVQELKKKDHDGGYVQA